MDGKSVTERNRFISDFQCNALRSTNICLTLYRLVWAHVVHAYEFICWLSPHLNVQRLMANC